MQIHRDCFSKSNDSTRCLIINLLAYLTCASDGTLLLKNTGNDLQCSLCSKHGGRQSRTTVKAADIQPSVFSIFSKLITLDSFLKSRQPRVIAMIALRRLVLHAKDAEMLDLEKSTLGQWCLQALQSSLRELRIAAGRAITMFVRREVGQHAGLQVLNRNTANALGFLKSVSDKNEANINETSLMAWGQMGRLVSDEGLNLVLAKMLEFLGHQNPIISAVALNEITNLASYRRTTPRRLLEPFWRTLAFSTVKDMFTQPQTTQMVADLLKTNVTELLLLIQSHALPWLVLHKKKDVIQRFLEARQETLSPSQRGKAEMWNMLYLDDTNLSAILSRLLVQDVPDIEEYVTSALNDICPSSSNLKELLSTNPVPTTLELLKLSGEGDESMKASVSLLLHDQKYKEQRV